MLIVYSISNIVSQQVNNIANLSILAHPVDWQRHQLSNTRKLVN